MSARRFIRTSSISVLLLAAFVQSSGCAALGLVAGRAIDRRNRTDVVVDCENPDLEAGRRVNLELRDGSRMSGHLLTKRCNSGPALVIEVERLNRPDTVDTVRVDSIESIEVQTTQLAKNLGLVGFLVDIGVVVIILEVQAGLARALD